MESNNFFDDDEFFDFLSPEVCAWLDALERGDFFAFLDAIERGIYIFYFFYLKGEVYFKFIRKFSNESLLEPYYMF